MKNSRATIPGLVLLAAVVVMFCLSDDLSPSQTRAADPPETIVLSGIVRDFRGDHPDMNPLPDLGLGHYADLVDRTLDPSHRPKLTGAGGAETEAVIHVDDTLELITGASIAGGVQVRTNSTAAGAISVEGGCSIDADVQVGPGGDPATVVSNDGTITGTLGVLASPRAMDPVVPPAESIVGPDLGDEWFKADATVNTNRYYQSLRISSGAIVKVLGHVVIRVDGDFTTETGGSLVLDADSSLTLYVSGAVKIKTKSQWSNASSTRIFVVGAPDVTLETEAEFFGSIIGPEADVLVQTKSILRGSLVCRSLLAKTDSALHPVPMGHASHPSYLVTTPWEDENGHHIAPHLAAAPSGGGGLMAAAEKVSSSGANTVFDGYRSSAGAYGGANRGLPIVVSSNGTSSNIIDLSSTSVSGDLLAGPGADVGTAIKLDLCTIDGAVGTLTTAVPMPTPSPPSDLGPSVGDRNFVGGAHVVDTDIHCDKFFVDGGATVTINGDVRILSETEFKVSASTLVISPGSSLTLHTNGNMKFEDGSTAKAADDRPESFLAYQLSTNTVTIDGASEVRALIEAPSACLSVTSSSSFYGTFVGREISITDDAQVHVDLDAAPAASPCAPGADVAGTAGAEGTAGITDADTFETWFKDVLGTNASGFHSITLTRSGDVYRYLDDAFHPIDGRLLGNEGSDANHFLTYAIAAPFTYEACGGQFIAFEGDDDCWIYIDDTLAIDLGGPHDAQRQRIDLDRLDLVDGTEYRMRLFYAQRRSEADMFRLTTNIEFAPPAPLSVSSAFD